MCASLRQQYDAGLLRLRLQLAGVVEIRTRREPFAVEAHEACLELRGIDRVCTGLEARGEIPVFRRNECHALALAVDHDAGGG